MLYISLKLENGGTHLYLMWLIFLTFIDLPAVWIGQRSKINYDFCILYQNHYCGFMFFNIVIKFTGYMEHWMNMNTWKNQIDVMCGFDYFFWNRGFCYFLTGLYTKMVILKDALSILQALEVEDKNLNNLSTSLTFLYQEATVVLPIDSFTLWNTWEWEGWYKSMVL